MLAGVSHLRPARRIVQAETDRAEHVHVDERRPVAGADEVLLARQAGTRPVGVAHPAFRDIPRIQQQVADTDRVERLPLRGEHPAPFQVLDDRQDARAGQERVEHLADHRGLVLDDLTRLVVPVGAPRRRLAPLGSGEVQVEPPFVLPLDLRAGSRGEHPGEHSAVVGVEPEISGQGLHDQAVRAPQVDQLLDLQRRPGQPVEVVADDHVGFAVLDHPKRFGVVAPLPLPVGRRAGLALLQVVLGEDRDDLMTAPRAVLAAELLLSNDPFAFAGHVLADPAVDDRAERLRLRNGFCGFVFPVTAGHVVSPWFGRSGLTSELGTKPSVHGTSRPDTGTPPREIRWSPRNGRRIRGRRRGRRGPGPDAASRPRRA